MELNVPTAAKALPGSFSHKHNNVNISRNLQRSNHEPGKGIKSTFTCIAISLHLLHVRLHSLCVCVACVLHFAWLGFAVALPVLCLVFALLYICFTVLSQLLRFAFALQLFCVCFALYELFS